MPTRSLEECELWHTIEDGSFGTIAEDELIRQIYGTFKNETERLKGAQAVERNTPPRIIVNGSQLPNTPSQVLFDYDYDEVNRTYTGVFALRWLLTNDYDRFTRGQQQEVKMKPDSFQWLKDYFVRNLQTSQDTFTLILAMVVNDLGKDPELADDFFRQTKMRISGSNHDIILLEAARHGMVPCLDYLDEAHRADLMLGLELGSELNAGQLAQAENVPVNLEGLLIMKDHERAFNMKYMELVLDVAGAAGHVFADGSKNLIEPVFQAYKTVLEVSLCIVQGSCSLQQGYNLVLSKRAKLLESNGFRLLCVQIPHERALLRLLTMGRVASLELAVLFDRAFDSLADHSKIQLINGLNIDAIDDNETAVIPYYMPAMIAETLRRVRGSGNEQEALASLLRYLARVLNWTPEDERSQLPTVKEGKAATWPSTLHIQTAPDPRPREGRVYERNMTKAKETINSPKFLQDPNVLDDLDPPEGYLLSRRRTSASTIECTVSKQNDTSAIKVQKTDSND